MPLLTLYLLTLVRSNSFHILASDLTADAFFIQNQALHFILAYSSNKIKDAKEHRFLGLNLSITCGFCHSNIIVFYKYCVINKICIFFT